jgi:transposase
MEQADDKKNVFEVTCPHCQSLLWVDGRIRSVIKAEKAAKKKSSLDDLLEKERKRKGEFEQKFEATAEMEKQKREKAKQKFAQAFEKVGKEGD